MSPLKKMAATRVWKQTRSNLADQVAQRRAKLHAFDGTVFCSGSALR